MHKRGLLGTGCGLEDGSDPDAVRLGDEHRGEVAVQEAGPEGEAQAGLHNLRHSHARLLVGHRLTWRVELAGQKGRLSRILPWEAKSGVTETDTGAALEGNVLVRMLEDIGIGWGQMETQIILSGNQVA